MSILTSIDIARKARVSDDQILNEIIKQNPNKKNVFEQAKSRGASSSDIINELIRQNSTTGAINTLEESTIKQDAQQNKGILRKVGDFFTGSTQKFAQTLGAAASVIDPKTKKMREETLSSARQQADMYMEMAKKETDKAKKEKYLKAAMTIADTEDLDIFNNPEYQKTAKQIFGEGAGVALETLSWGKVGNLAKSSRALTAGQMALRSAGTGGTIGAISGASQALQENKSMKDVAVSSLKGGATGAVVSGAIGYGTGKLVGKVSQKQATKIVSPKLTSAEKELAAKSGRLKSRTLLRGERYLPSDKDKELGRLAQDIGLKGKDVSRDIGKANTALEREAATLKSILQKRKAIFNKNNIKGQLNKMKADQTADLIDGELRPYNNYIAKFNKMVEGKKNKGLDGLLELRQDFDKWALSNNPNIFENKRGGAYRALIAVRNTINDYINQKAGDDVVKNSLKKQSNLYSIINRIAEKSAQGSGLKSSRLAKPGKTLLKVGGVAAGGKMILGKKSGEKIIEYNAE